MQNKMTLNFSVDEVSIYETVKGNRFSSAVINCFASGENAHTLPIDEKVLIKCADSIYNIPLNYTMNIFKSDFVGHNGADYILGFIPENEANSIQLVRCEDGRLFLKIKALIWNRYAKDALKILQDKKGETMVSAEITLTKTIESNEGTEVLEFVFESITLLGISPAIKGAKLNMLFDKDKQSFLKGIKFEDNFLCINNSKDSALETRWYNGRKKLFSEISMSVNKTDLINEAFLKVNDTTNYADVLYPHHSISKGELVLHIKGVKLAFQEAVLNGDMDENTTLHLFKHFLEIGLNETNFCSFGITEEQFDLYFAKLLKGGKERVEAINDKTIEENLETDVIELDNAEEEVIEKETIAEEEVVEEEVVEEDEPVDKIDSDEEIEDETDSEEKTEEIISEEEEEEIDSEEKIEEVEDEKNSEEEIEEAEVIEDTTEGEEPQFTQEEFEKMCANFAKVQALNEELQAKIDSMSDYEDLVKFKADTEAAEARAAEMQAMDKIFDEVVNRGVSMSESEKEDLKTKVKEFSSVESWGNYVKAYMFDKMDTKSTLTRIDIPNLHNQTESKSKGIWG